ncbi:MAG: hypothetical protein PVI30_05285 [Myxococcales bacterium]
MNEPILGRALIEAEVPAERALARAQVLWRSVTPERPVTFYGAGLAGSALCLGALQHAPAALSAAGLKRKLLRRRTGGITAEAGTGIAYAALGLLDPSSLMACPPGRILNRNVRGALAGLRGLKLPTHYFGRDFLSVDGSPAALVAWTRAADGRALLELLVAVDSPLLPDAEQLGYPPRVEPVFRGKPPSTLRDAGLAADVEPADVPRALATGYARAHGLELEREDLGEEERVEVEALAGRLVVDGSDDGGLRWSTPVEEPIGFVQAGVRLDADGRIAAARLAGDFMQDEACTGELQAQLEGAEPSAATFGAALDRIYAAQPGRVEGVRNLPSLQGALLSAAGGEDEP